MATGSVPNSLDPEVSPPRWPVVAALILGYVGGGALAFGVHFLDLFAGFGSPMARFTLVLFGMGVLGAAAYQSAQWWPGLDGERWDRGGVAPLAPGLILLLTFVGGGISGVVLYLAVKAGVALALVGDVTPQIRFSVAAVVAFCGGLGFMQLRRILRRRRLRVSEGQSRPESTGTSAEDRGGASQ